MTDTKNSRPTMIIAVTVFVGLGLLVFGAIVGSGSGTDQDPNFTGGVVRLGDTPAAMVNGSMIYTSDVQNVAQAQNLIGENDLIDPDDPVFDQVLSELIDQRLMAQAAINRALDQQSEAKRRLAQTRERVLGNILVEEHLKQTVNETTMRQMYEAQTALRERGVEARARHIQLPDEAMANEIIRRLDAGESFEALALAFSQDRASRDNAGDLGYFARDMLDAELTRQAFTAPIGERVGPFKTELGWHVMEVLDRRQAKLPSFEETRQDIKTFMTYEEINKLLISLRETAEIEKLQNQDIESGKAETATAMEDAQ